MTQQRLLLTDLVITDGALPPAMIRFGPGLNLLIGASDTGKTFVFDAIDFMLGAKGPLRRIPESDGYNWISLSVEPTVGPSVTLRRKFNGSDFELIEFGNGRDHPSTATRVLSATHSTDPESSLSAYLLRAIGLEGRRVRKNDRGETEALSFRHVCHLNLVSEERVIQQISPVLSGQHITRTSERNRFAFFLTGQDDSNVTAQESAEQRRLRLEVEAATVESILNGKRLELESLLRDPTDLSDQASKLENVIEEAARTVVVSQAEITQLEQRRKTLFEAQTAAHSRLRFLEEQMKRFRLLDEYYDTDHSRLVTLVEASRVFHELPEGTCPLCNQSLTGSRGELTHDGLESACRKEMEKIETLRHDLSAAISDFRIEEAEMRSCLDDLTLSLQALDDEMQQKLVPASRTAAAELTRLVQSRTAVAHGASLLATIQGLEERLEQARQAQKKKPAKEKFANRATTSTANELCKVIESILRDWRYPNLGGVSFDSETLDLVIGGQIRATKGKGYRAITHAAFVIGLMKLCRQKGIPHPGFVVLDTPVNPFKGPTPTLPDLDDRLTDEVKAAFFEFLATDTSGDQYIVMENESPPAKVRERATYYEFTKRPDFGRYGFFPVRSAPPSKGGGSGT